MSSDAPEPGAPKEAWGEVPPPPPGGTWVLLENVLPEGFPATCPVTPSAPCPDPSRHIRPDPGPSTKPDPHTDAAWEISNPGGIGAPPNRKASPDACCLGRSPLQWCLLLGFYALFYSFLGCFFLGLMWIHEQTLDAYMPTYSWANGGLLQHPSVSVWPRHPWAVELIPRLDIFTEDQRSVHAWADYLERRLQNYDQHDTYGQHIVDCLSSKPTKGEYGEYEVSKKAPDEVCGFTLDKLGPCSTENQWGYAEGRPCIVLKMNRMIGWEPDTFSHEWELPPNLPAPLKEAIRGETDEDGYIRAKRVWVGCEGKTSEDRDNLGTANFTYHPFPGFDASFFPYSNQPGYRSPLVAVQLAGLPRDLEVTLVCRVYARNVMQSVKDVLGLAVFQVQVGGMNMEY